MSETDKEFVERVALDVQVRGDIYGFDRPRLVTLARRGADAADKIERLRTLLKAIRNFPNLSTHYGTLTVAEIDAALKEDGDGK